MEPTLVPSSPSPSFSDLPTTVHEHQDSCTLDDTSDFAFVPLLPRRSGRAHPECPRSAFHCAAPAAAHPPPPRSRPAPQPASSKASAAAHRRLRWHAMAFGSVRVPAAMDMSEVRRRLGRGRLAEEEVGWAPWRLIRSLSCKAVEGAAVAVAVAPVRLA